jgi:cation diffusion facilitator CzcD-associated flavoprotein CzcO
MADFPIRETVQSFNLGKRKNRAEEDVKRRLNGPIHQERHMKIICVGAGASGLLFAYKLQRHFENFELIIYEKNSEVSGTWWENKYPGCACDVPSHNYTWSFEPKLDWSAVYAGSGEIFEYFNSFASKYRLHKYVKTRHQVVGAAWDNERPGWKVTIKDLEYGNEFEHECDILINASGILNNWRWPAIPGLFDYEGKLLHTANWDDSVDLTGKHVGLIGNGSSGIQVLPTIQPKVKHVTTFIREPTWVSPVQGLEQHVFNPQERHDFAHKPGALTEYRKKIETGLNGQFAMFLKGSTVNNATHDYMVEQMKQKLNDERLITKLIPEWSVGCRRLTPGVGYLESLTEPNVTVVYGEIEKITEKGCVCDDGKEYPIDVLICATGFDTTFKPRFPLIAPNGKNLQDEWAQEPRSYLGIAASDFPNYLIFLGNHPPPFHGMKIKLTDRCNNRTQLPHRQRPRPFRHRTASRLHVQTPRPLANTQHPLLLPKERSNRRLHLPQRFLHEAYSMERPLSLLVQVRSNRCTDHRFVAWVNFTLHRSAFRPEDGGL